MSRLSLRVVILTVLGLGILVLLVIYFPVGVVRQFRQRDDEKGPEWMGDVRGRKRRLAVILTVFLAAGLALGAFALLQP
jgi:hypothetical protein